MKLLFLDIETAPHLVAAWGLYDQNIAINQIIKPGYTLCWAAKWHGDKEVMFDSVQKSKSSAMVKRIHKLLSEADAVCHYNGDKFDMPTLNKEFLLEGLNPPPPSKQIDLLKTARRNFKLASNKLDYVAQQLGLGQKEHHKGMTLWLECMEKDPEAWTVMERYNKQDVILLERVYERLLPWIKNHPNHAIYDLPGVPICPKCGGGDLQRRGYARTDANVYAKFACKSCGSWSREAVSEMPKEDRQNIMRPI